MNCVQDLECLAFCWPLYWQPSVLTLNCDVMLLLPTEFIVEFIHSLIPYICVESPIEITKTSLIYASILESINIF